jgi:hypothetical protein
MGGASRQRGDLPSLWPRRKTICGCPIRCARLFRHDVLCGGVSEASFTVMHPFAGERGGVCLAGPVTTCAPGVLWALMTGSD